VKRAANTKNTNMPCPAQEKRHTEENLIHPFDFGNNCKRVKRIPLRSTLNINSDSKR